MEKRRFKKRIIATIVGLAVVLACMSIALCIDKKSHASKPIATENLSDLDNPRVIERSPYHWYGIPENELLLLARMIKYETEHDEDFYKDSRYAYAYNSGYFKNFSVGASIY